MRLVEFRIQNYKRIEDSGTIPADDVIALVGRNESGKTAVLQALWKLKPGRENIVLDPQDEFPRHRYTTDFERRGTGPWPVVTARFSVDPETRAALTAIDAAFDEVEAVECTSFYDLPTKVRFIPDVELQSLKSDHVAHWMEQMREQILGSEVDLTPIDAVKLQDASLDAEQEEIWQTPEQVVEAFKNDASALIAEASRTLSPDAGHDDLRELVGWLIGQLEAISPEAWQESTWIDATGRLTHLVEQPLAEERLLEAKEVAWSAVPVFVYFDDYNMLESKIHIPEAIQRISSGSTDPRVRSQWALFERAGFNVAEIADLTFQGNPTQSLSHDVLDRLFTEVERRAILASAAGRSITDEFSEWWIQHHHEIEFHVDGEFFQIWVSDRDYRAPIKFEGRSQGFRWFFTFYLVFTVETGYEHKNAVLLLDEPGLHLYPPQQEVLLALFNRLARNNQVIYTSHSPFMVDRGHLERVRFLEELDGGLARISPDIGPISGRAVFPAQAAFLHNVARLLLLARRILIVESETGHLLLQFLSDWLQANGRTGLPDNMVIGSAGGSQGVKPLVAMLLPHGIQMVVLLDSDDPGKSAGKKLDDSGFSSEPSVKVLYYGKLLGTRDAFDLASMLPEDVYLAAVEASLGTELPEIKRLKKETLSAAVEKHFAEQGWEFDTDAPLTWLLDSWRQNPNHIPPALLDNAEQVFEAVGQAFGNGGAKPKPRKKKAPDEPAASAGDK